MTISTLVGARASKGFTLAELLIALAILGVIATFTIPKILSSSQNGQNTAIAKEAASMISGAFQSYTLNNGIASANHGGDLTQYMNYVAVQTTGTLSAHTGTGDNLATCAAATMCLKLHNGGVLQVDTAHSFGGTAATNGIFVDLDPDGAGPAPSISFIQYANGRLTTRGAAGADPTSGGTVGIPKIVTDPTYLTNWN